MAPDKATHHIPVMNLSDVTRSLHEGTRLDDTFPVESFKHVQEMLLVDSDVSDTDSDDDEVTDVCATGITSRSASSKTPRTNACDNARMDTDLPVHLQPSWSGYRKISLLENVRSLQWPFMSTEKY